MIIVMAVVGAVLAALVWFILSVFLPQPIPLFVLFGLGFAWLVHVGERQDRLQAWLSELDPEGARRRRKEEIDPASISARDQIKAKMDAYAKAHEEKRQGGK